MATFQTTIAACRIVDRAEVWVAYRDGRMLYQANGRPMIGSAVEMAAIGRMDASR